MITVTWDQHLRQNRTGSDGHVHLISRLEAHRCVELLMLTANVHRDRDFGDGGSRDGGKNGRGHAYSIFKKVNSPPSATTINGNNYGPYNWMKVRFGTVANNVGLFPDLEIVIVYHLLRHRIRDGVAAGNLATYGVWSTSVAFHPHIVSSYWLSQPVNPRNPNDPCVTLSEAIATQMNLDLKGMEALGEPSGTYSVIYDDYNGTTPAENVRKRTRIGRIGLICGTTGPNANATVAGKFEIIGVPTVIPRPYTDDNTSPIPGWGNDGDSQIVCTTLRAR